MKYAYYPGCSAESVARDQHISSLAVAKSLGLEFSEPKGWTCCGATPAHQTSRLLGAALPAVNLLAVKKMGLDMVVNCAACYGRMKTANHEILGNPDLKSQVEETLGESYDGSVRVRHFMEILQEDVGIAKLRESLVKSLRGLKVACYYGCLLVRPHEVTGFDNPENPVFMDNLVNAMGGESLDWPCKVDCCGGSASIPRTDVAVGLSAKIIEMAEASDAGCIAVACPMCQSNLDLRQSDIKRTTGKKFQMPILYITQLLGLCLGLSPQALGMEKLMISPLSVLNTIGTGV